MYQNATIATLKESEPFDEASKWEDYEQSRRLCLHLRYKGRRFRITACVSSGVKEAVLAFRRSNGTLEVSVFRSNPIEGKPASMSWGDSLAADQIVIAWNGL